MKKWTGLILSVLILGAARLSAQAADAPRVLALLEIRGLDSLAAAAFELSQAAGSPTPKEMVSMVLYGALGTMPGMGIPAEGTVRAVAFENGSDRGGWAILLPVADEGARTAGRTRARPPTACCTTSRRTAPPCPGRKSIS